jgi:type VI secretion system protein ImpH
MAFPPSGVAAIERPTVALSRPADPLLGEPPGRPTVVVAFLGLTGPSGALPLHYTQTILRLAREGKGPERTALRDWLDLFNHRLIAQYFRAWEKYRFPVTFARYALGRRAVRPGDAGPEPDAFTRALFSLIGLGVRPLRRRLRVDARPADPAEPPAPLARIDDLALLRYAGLFARRPRTAAGLEAVLADYFGLPARVVQFTGQWLYLEPASLTRLADGAPGELGVNAVAGERVWDVVSKFRVRLGPLRYAAFVELLPDPAPVPQRKGSFLLAQLVRLYVGPEFDFEVQLVLRGDEVPECRLQEVPEGALGARLGWNTWMPGDAMPAAVDDVVFDAREDVIVGG